MTFKVAGIGSLHGKQIIVSLADESTGSRYQPGSTGTTWELRITADEAPDLIERLQRAYAETMQRALLEVAAGGCRTCGNNRTVAGQPCPACTPRAEDRIRRALFLRRRPS